MPATNREQLAAAFPDHFHRIVECMYEGPMAMCPQWLDWPVSYETAYGALASAFIWGGTSEGHGYWSALAQGARS